ncbi:MAG: DUF5107 domain-containing protein [Kiritimatiellae bacterium]|nr:DUF5107 domain-containing protein [Kiritimatiellia bacterium]
MKIFAAGTAALFACAACAAAVTLSESAVEMPTYPFSDPDPVPCTVERRYPYFRYDGSSRESVARKWKVVGLDNGKIAVDILPETGGKVWGATDKAAALALSANDANFDALLVSLVAARGRLEAADMAKAMLEKYPLFHAARYELEGTGFRRFVRNELPEQTFIELASWYAETGLLENALELFALAGENPIALVRAAHLSNDAATLAKAASLPVSGVFPFRRETLPALRWAAKSGGSWKFRYYLAVALASFHLDAEADALLDGCGNGPGEDVFYLFRAGRRTGEARLADLLRAKALKDSWRTGRALCRHYAETKDWKRMLETAEECDRRFPGRSPIQIARATALVRCGRPKDAIAYLETQTVLPSEFGDDAMEIWHEAQKLLDLPPTWPENLGKGKPFASM